MGQKNFEKRKNIITIAIDSPAAAGAGTQAKIANEYNLLYLDTVKYTGTLANLSWIKRKIFNNLLKDR